ncbi:MAG: thiamine pyrophosphate-binding protein [Sandaracinaceae bacterium]
MLRLGDQAEHGGDLVAQVLADHGVRHVTTLCGGHISPLLVGAKRRSIAVVDCRDERNAVFAADAIARLTGRPGVAAVTAGPGVTNAMTALKNAQLAETPLALFGGATATILKGRGALQDIEQLPLVRSAVKWAVACRTVPELPAVTERALQVAADGVPGPVFVEVPVDLLYPESLVREWYFQESGADRAKGLGGRALRLYLEGHLWRQFRQPYLGLRELGSPRGREPAEPAEAIDRVVERIRRAERPALIVGSQAMVGREDPAPLAEAVTRLGMPVWLGGMARGLLGRHSPIQLRHKRGKALKEADLVVVAGFPFDFRLKYGQGFSRSGTLVSANLDPEALRKNRRPDHALHMHPGDFLLRLAERVGPGPWEAWFDTLRERESARDEEIRAQAKEPGELVHPVDLFLRLEEKLADDAVLVADGGDFVATAAYILRPRGPLRWLDPGVFGTLGVGGGFAVGAGVVRPTAETWIIYGDGSSAYSLAEFDTFVRHGLAPIAVVGTDGSWAQIARDQVDVLGDSVGTDLLRNDYHRVAEGYGGVGLLLTDPARIDETLDEAKALAASGKPVLINVHIRRTDFRKGSISI